jgi:glycerophosphoryl diester phosphodiesterase
MQIYAHRGASRDFPEGSRAAYEGAVGQGADGFECDVRLTKDGQIICWHDSDTSRLAGEKKSIAWSTLADLEFAAPYLLSDLIELAIATKKNLAIETKHPVVTRGVIEYKVAALLDLYRDAITAAGIDLVLFSFSSAAVRRATRLGVPSVHLLAHRYQFFYDRALFGVIKKLSGRKIDIGPGLHLVKAYPEIVARAHKTGRRVFVWTVNDAADIALCEKAGVDVVMSDIPFQARKALGYS